LNSFDQWSAFFYLVIGQNLGYLHPIHPTLVHLPIGLIVGAFILYYVSFLTRNTNLARTARIMAILAFIAWFFTVLLGIMDWRYRYGGAWLYFFKAKMILAGVLFVVLLLILALGTSQEERRKTLLVLYSMAFLTVVGLGFFGGQLTYGGETPSAPQAFKPGEWLYRAHCSACHPCGGNVIDTHSPVYKSPLTSTPQIFQSWVRQPAAPMPPFPPSILSDEKTKELYAYVSRVINTLAK
jgi:uncharacterized membrane protein